jgi:hypothetical protein
VFLLNSRLGLLTAPPQSSLLKDHPRGDPFSLSYGVNLPSSLTRGLPSTLGYLPPPTCVGFRYGRLQLPRFGFSWPQGSTGSLWLAPQLPRASPPFTGRLRPWRQHLQRHPRPTPQRPQAGLCHLQAVTEYKPFVHRLRAFASA